MQAMLAKTENFSIKVMQIPYSLMIIKTFRMSWITFESSMFRKNCGFLLQLVCWSVLIILVL